MDRSRELFEEAQKHLVGGVNSPARSYEPHPIFMERGEGSKIYDVDGNEYVDYSLAFGPMILGTPTPRWWSASGSGWETAGPSARPPRARRS